MSRIKDAIIDIQERGWPVNNDSLKRLAKERQLESLEKKMNAAEQKGDMKTYNQCVLEIQKVEAEIEALIE